MRNQGRVAVVVDGYGMGNYFHDAFASHGIRLIHVLSTPDVLPDIRPPDLSRYVENIPWTTLGEVAERVAAHCPFAVVPGIEPGVPLADQLNEMLGLAGNSSALSRARRDKYLMIEQIRRHGLHCAEQLTSSSPEEIEAWVASRADFPVVVKPLESASTDGVRICSDLTSVRDAVQEVLGSRTIFGAENLAALVQSFLDGDEYVVDTVSCAGRAYVCGVWKYHKVFVSGDKKVYERDILMDPDDDTVQELARYTRGVLDALGIHYGPAHAEIMMTADGPALVEIGARMNGNLKIDLHRKGLGHDQAQLTALALTEPGTFLAEYAGRPYRKRREAIHYQAHTRLRGTVRSVDEAVVARIRGLAGVDTLHLRLVPGSRIAPTTNSLLAPFDACLVGPDLAALEQDCDTLRELTDQVYVVKPEHEGHEES